MRYDDLVPGDSIIDTNGDVWTLMTPRDKLGDAVWMSMSDLRKVDLCMRGDIPVHYKVCTVPREGR